MRSEERIWKSSLRLCLNLGRTGQYMVIGVMGRLEGLVGMGLKGTGNLFGYKGWEITFGEDGWVRLIV